MTCTSNWQPIATAPIDQEILVYEEQSGRLRIAEWVATEDPPGWGTVPGAIRIKPDIWQPIPEPPPIDEAGTECPLAYDGRCSMTQDAHDCRVHGHRFEGRYDQEPKGFAKDLEGLQPHQIVGALQIRWIADICRYCGEIRSRPIRSSLAE